jgi:D-alanine transfer protein
MGSRDPEPATEPAGAHHTRLIAGLVAAAFVLGAECALLVYGQVEVHAKNAALDPVVLDKEWRGKAAQLEVLHRDDLLPMYGSSELIVPMPNRVTDFFAPYPTGFSVAPIGARGYPMLSMAVALGSLGSAARGRRIVISLSGTWFTGDQEKYAVINFRTHFSQLQTGDLIFRSNLPIELRRRLAARILGYRPRTGIDPLLAIALSCLAERCVFEPLLPALAPLWMLTSLPSRARDYALLAGELKDATPPRRHLSRPDWNELEARGDSVWRAQSASNPFGIQDSIWSESQTQVLSSKGTSSDSLFLASMQHTPGWEDLDLLLATMKALGARPLVLDTPLKGVYWDYVGVSGRARDRFYRQFDSATAPFHVAARNFSEYDADPLFLSEPRSHLSAKGWAVYDRTINAFYHDSLR